MSASNIQRGHCPSSVDVSPRPLICRRAGHDRAMLRPSNVGGGLSAGLMACLVPACRRPSNVDERSP